MCQYCESLKYELRKRNTQDLMLIETMRVLLHANLEGVQVSAEYANQVHTTLRQYEQQIEVTDQEIGE